MATLKLITHNGSFHADDIFAAATVSLVLEKQNKEFEIIRTRDPEIISGADITFDIGGTYLPEKNIFDHHQPGGAGERENGIPYAAFGLVWKNFGAQLCSSDKVVELIDEKLVSPIDAWDNGIDLVENKRAISPYFIQHAFASMRPTWKEDITEDEMFFKCVSMAKEILSREIIQTEDMLSAADVVLSAYNNAQDKRIIILEDNCPTSYALKDFPEPTYIIYPRHATLDWGARTVKADEKTFINKKDFPKLWGGLRDEELQKVTGVPDAVFCHRALFLAVAKSKEGAIKLAQIALES